MLLIQGISFKVYELQSQKTYSGENKNMFELVLWGGRVFGVPFIQIKICSTHKIFTFSLSRKG